MNEKEIQQTICSRIRLLRKERGMTLAEFSKFLGIPKTTISHWELNDIDTMKLSNLSIIARKCDVSDGWIMGGDVPRHRFTDEENAKVVIINRKLLAYDSSQLDMVIRFLEGFVDAKDDTQK